MVSGRSTCNPPLLDYLVELADLRNEVGRPYAVTPFVVIPAHNFEQVAAKHLREIGGEDRAVRIANDTSREDRIFGVTEYALGRPVSRFLHGGVHVFLRHVPR